VDSLAKVRRCVRENMNNPGARMTRLVGDEDMIAFDVDERILWIGSRAGNVNHGYGKRREAK
jgi:hypothetical protein